MISFLTAMEKFMYPAAASRVREMGTTIWLKSGLFSGSAFQHSNIIAKLSYAFSILSENHDA